MSLHLFQPEQYRFDHQLKSGLPLEPVIWRNKSLAPCFLLFSLISTEPFILPNDPSWQGRCGKRINWKWLSELTLSLASTNGEETISLD